MFESEFKIRVRYSETDQMGFVYYGNYAQYYEVARVEALRSIGASYKELEKSGIMMPVVQMNISFRKPAHYDDELKIITKVCKMPSVKMQFFYEIYCKDILINTAETILVFVDKNTMRPCHCPEWFLDLFSGFNLLT